VHINESIPIAPQIIRHGMDGIDQPESNKGGLYMFARKLSLNNRLCKGPTLVEEGYFCEGNIVSAIREIPCSQGPIILTSYEPD